MAKGRADGPDLDGKGAAGAKKGAAGAPAGAAAGRASRAAKAGGPTAEGEAPKRGVAKGAGSAKAAGAAKGGAAARSAGSGGTGGSRGSSGRTTVGKARSAKGAADLRKDLRDFAGTRPQGWSHDDWLVFLDDLQARGHNVNDRDEIGSMLERERLALALEKIPGVGPSRVRTIADRYGYLWRLRETNAEQLAREADVPKAVAEKVIAALSG